MRARSRVRLETGSDSGYARLDTPIIPCCLSNGSLDPDTQCSACISLEGAGKSSSEMWQLYLNIVARINIEFSKMTAGISSAVSSHR
jgi:hypothetical protein